MSGPKCDREVTTGPVQSAVLTPPTQPAVVISLTPPLPSKVATEATSKDVIDNGLVKIPLGEGEGRDLVPRSLSAGITHELLAKHFHLPLTVVSKKFGLCPTALKKLCRKFGIVRWPYRKLKMLDKKIAALRAEAIYASGKGAFGKQDGDLQKLEQARADIFNAESRCPTASSVDDEDDEDDDEDEDEDGSLKPVRGKVERGSIAFLTGHAFPTKTPASARNGADGGGHGAGGVGRGAGGDSRATLGSSVQPRSRSEGDAAHPAQGTGERAAHGAGLGDGAGAVECVQLTVLHQHAASVAALCASAGIPLLLAAPCLLPAPGPSLEQPRPPPPLPHSTPHFQPLLPHHPPLPDPPHPPLPRAPDAGPTAHAPRRTSLPAPSASAMPPLSPRAAPASAQGPPPVSKDDSWLGRGPPRLPALLAYTQARAHNPERRWHLDTAGDGAERRGPPEGSQARSAS